LSGGPRVAAPNVEAKKNPPTPTRMGDPRPAAEVGGLWATRLGGENGRKRAPGAGAVADGAAGRTIQGNRQQANGNRQVERVCERR
ncbi:hypothetical protein, partial [Xanthomonas euvesicatoria]|uniref:hypothetical protein n=1 Tax=Xanthomonas euvesicatoria TaxID=456327 RepID=UPI003891C11C